jgi:GlcNAc-P-P-Und epimerase
MNYLIFGGSGFIGTHLIRLLTETVATAEDKIYDIDLVMPGEEGAVPGVVEKIAGVEYVRGDVRKPVDFDFTPTKDDMIFNLAAVHRTPGHADREYYETNLPGAQNVTAFAEKHGIRRMLFTSSIAPYGASEALREETDVPMPDGPYGVSKLVAEEIHRTWQARDPARELTIVRPGVVYGAGEHGNFTRLYRSLRRRYFFYAGRRDTVKACIYVKELVLFFRYRMIDNRIPGAELFNCTFEPACTIRDICEIILKVTGLKRRIPLVPGGLLMFAAVCLTPFGGKKLGLHPARVRKLMISTNICGRKLAASGYLFHYTLEESIRDWYRDCGERGLR